MNLDINGFSCSVQHNLHSSIHLAVLHCFFLVYGRFIAALEDGEGGRGGTNSPWNNSVAELQKMDKHLNTKKKMFTQLLESFLTLEARIVSEKSRCSKLTINNTIILNTGHSPHIYVNYPVDNRTGICRYLVLVDNWWPTLIEEPSN